MISVVDYKPLNERQPDLQYQARLRLIAAEGLPAKSFHAEPSRTYMGLPAMRFNLQNGIPLTTVRDLNGSWRSAIGEILAFINGICTQDELVNEFKVNRRFWEDSVTAAKCAQFDLPPGHLGFGSYGDAFKHLQTPWGTEFDQMRNVLHQMRAMPDVRTHWVDPWVPYYAIKGETNQRRVVVAPCHGWMHWRIINEELHLQMHQRSADMPIGVVFNTFQYSALLLAVAHVLRRKAAWFYHSFSDAHIYNNQMAHVAEMVSREPRALPRLDLTDDAPDDLFAFRPRHFVLSEYSPHPAMNNIPFSV